MSRFSSENVSIYVAKRSSVNDCKESRFSSENVAIYVAKKSSVNDCKESVAKVQILLIL